MKEGWREGERAKEGNSCSFGRPELVDSMLQGAGVRGCRAKEGD